MVFTPLDEEPEADVDKTLITGAFWDPERKVINPFSLMMSRWNAVLISVLIWTSLGTPFEIGFLEPSYNGLFFVNRLLDMIWLIDISFHFVIDPVNERHLKDENNMPAHGKMAWNYITGWFFFDLVATFPFDWLSIIYSSEGDSTASKLKFLRAMRLMRLVKIVRLLRMSRVFEVYEDTVAINFALLSLTKFMGGTLLVSHWFACLWYITYYVEEASNSWVVQTTVDSFSTLESDGVSTVDKYVASWYFAVMTMSTIGYGDISPVTSTERIICNFMMLVGAGIYAYIVGSITSVVRNMEAQSRRYQELMDLLNLFLEENKISNPLRVEARKFLRTRQAQGNLTEWGDLLAELSPDLREHFARQTHTNWAESSIYLQGADAAFQAKVASQFQEVTYPSGEKIVEIGQPVDSLYVIKKGAVGAHGRVLCKGDVLGEDIVLNKRLAPDYRCNYVATALTFTAVECIPMSTLNELVSEFSDVKEMVRKRLIWQIGRNACWAYASAMLEIQGKRRLVGARDRDLVNHYLWKVKWMSMTGLRAVKLFKAVIRIQKVTRGHICRKKYARSKTEGIGAIHTVAQGCVDVGVQGLYEHVVSLGKDKIVARANEKAEQDQKEYEMLKAISDQIKSLSGRVSAMEY